MKRSSSSSLQRLPRNKLKTHTDSLSQKKWRQLATTDKVCHNKCGINLLCGDYGSSISHYTVAAKETLLKDKQAENVKDLRPSGDKLLPEWEIASSSLRQQLVNLLYVSNTRGRFCSIFPHQVSFVVLHPWRADEVVLLAPPVAEAAEEVVWEESVDGVSNDVDVHRLFYPEPDKDMCTEEALLSCNEVETLCRRDLSPRAAPLLTW